MLLFKAAIFVSCVIILNFPASLEEEIRRGFDGQPLYIPPPPSQIYLIKGMSSQKCLEVSRGRTHVSAAVEIWDCGDGNKSQMRWRLVGQNYTPVEYGNMVIPFLLQNLNSGLCLATRRDEMTDRASIIQESCDLTEHRKRLWYFRSFMSDSSVYKELVNLESRKCLDVYGEQREDGSSLILYSCSQKGHQMWALEPVPEHSVANDDEGFITYEDERCNCSCATPWVLFIITLFTGLGTLAWFGYRYWNASQVGIPPQRLT